MTKCDQVTEKTERNPISIVYFGSVQSDLYTAFNVVASENTKAVFYHVEDSECAKNFQVVAPTILIFRTFDVSPLEYSGIPRAHDLLFAIKTASVPVLIDFSEEYVTPIFEEQNDAIILFTNKKRNDEYYFTFEEAALKLQGSVLFVVSGTEEGI
jgi:hypothetical protein